MIVYAKHKSQNLALDSFEHSFQFDLACKLLTVYIHADEPITEEIKITFESEEGAAYSTLIEARTLQNEADYVFAAQGSVAFNENDKVKVEITNANEIGIVGVTVKMEK